MTAAMRPFSSHFAYFYLSIVIASAQENYLLSRLRTLHLRESSGSVPIMYVPSGEQRALYYQKELQNARAWFEKELGIEVPLVLAVGDRETYQFARGPAWPLPFSDPRSTPGLIVFPTRIEELIGPDPQSKMPGEAITYHEAGHIFADRLKLWSGNLFVNEVIANVFSSAYTKEKRPDLVGAPPPRIEKEPRYTSLADLDYIYTGMGPQNYVWFQVQLGRLANYLLEGQTFSKVIEKARAEFPAPSKKQETLDSIVSRLERIRPGTKALLGGLAGPTTLPTLKPSECTGGGVRPESQSYIAVRNNDTRPLTLKRPEGTEAILPANSWRAFGMEVGASLKLPDGTCLIARDEPALTLIERW